MFFYLTAQDLMLMLVILELVFQMHTKTRSLITGLSGCPEENSSLKKERWVRYVHISVTPNTLFFWKQYTYQIICFLTPFYKEKGEPTSRWFCINVSISYTLYRTSTLVSSLLTVFKLRAFSLEICYRMIICFSKKYH